MFTLGLYFILIYSVKCQWPIGSHHHRPGGHQLGPQQFYVPRNNYFNHQAPLSSASQENLQRKVFIGPVLPPAHHLQQQFMNQHLVPQPPAHYPRPHFLSPPHQNQHIAGQPPHSDGHEHGNQEEAGPAVIVDMKQVFSKLKHKIKTFKERKMAAKEAEDEEEDEEEGAKDNPADNPSKELLSAKNILFGDSRDKMEKRLLLVPSMSKVILSILAPKMLKLQFDLMLQAMFAEMVKKLVIPVTGAIARGKLSPSGTRFIPNYYPREEAEDEDGDEEEDEIDGTEGDADDDYGERRGRRGGKRWRKKRKKQFVSQQSLTPSGAVIVPSTPSIVSTVVPASPITSSSAYPSQVVPPSIHQNYGQGSPITLQPSTGVQQQYILSNGQLIPVGTISGSGYPLGMPVGGFQGGTGSSSNPIIFSSGGQGSPIFSSGQSRGFPLVMSSTSNNPPTNVSTPSSSVISETNLVPEGVKEKDEDEEMDNTETDSKYVNNEYESGSDDYTDRMSRLKSGIIKIAADDGDRDKERRERWNTVLKGMNHTVVS